MPAPEVLTCKRQVSTWRGNGTGPTGVLDNDGTLRAADEAAAQLIPSDSDFVERRWGFDSKDDIPRERVRIRDRRTDDYARCA
jgi:hypothetical protein